MSKQTTMPGASPDVSGALQRKADARLQPKVPQKACDAGLFSDTSTQIDLIDYLNHSAAKPNNR